MKKYINSSIAKISGATVVILITVFIIMQFSEEVNWQLGDFIIAAFLIVSILSIIELIRIKVSVKKHRILLILLAIILFLLIWVELAVGLFGF